MTQIYPTLRNMTFEEQREAGQFNKGLILEHGRWAYRLTAWTTDSLHIFEAGALIYVLTINVHMDYVALDCFIGSEIDPVDSIVLQGHYTINEALGGGWHLMSLYQLVMSLKQLFA